MGKRTEDDQEVRAVEDSKREEGGKRKRRKAEKENVAFTAEADAKDERKRRREDETNVESPAEDGIKKRKKKKRKVATETAGDDAEPGGEETDEVGGSESQKKNEEPKRKKEKKQVPDQVPPSSVASEENSNKKKRSSDVSEEVVDKKKKKKKQKDVVNDELPGVSANGLPQSSMQATNQMEKATKDGNHENAKDKKKDRKADQSDPEREVVVPTEETEVKKKKKKKKAPGGEAPEHTGDETTVSRSDGVSEQVTEKKKKKKKMKTAEEKELPVEEGGGSKKNETGSIIGSGGLAQTVDEVGREATAEKTGSKRKRSSSTELNDDAVQQKKKQRKDSERPAKTTEVHDVGSRENGREGSTADESKRKKKKKPLTVEAEIEDNGADSPKEADKSVEKTKKQPPVVESQADRSKTKQNTVTGTGNSGVSGGGKEKEPLGSVPPKKKKKVTFAVNLVTELKPPGELLEDDPKPKKKVSFGEAVVVKSGSQLERPLCQNRQKEPLYLKTFTEEEVGLIKQKIDWLIEDRSLGWSQKEVYEFLLDGRRTDRKLYKELWSHLRTCVPGRSKTATTNRVKNFLYRETCPNKGKWSQEEVDQLMLLVKQHNENWPLIGQALGRTKVDANRKYKYLTAHKVKGHYSDEDISRITAAVHKMLAYNVKHKLPVMRRDDIAWRSVENMVGRPNSHCRVLWYRDLCSSMITKGEWESKDDHVMLLRLLESGATEESEVDWENLLSNRSGEVSRNRWNEMRAHLGHRWSWPLDKKLEILVKRFAPCFLEDDEGPCPVQEAVDPVPCGHNNDDEAEKDKET